MQNLFDSIGKTITSLNAVIFVMLLTIASMTFFSHTLFITVFPDHMEIWEKELAAWLMAISWEATVLVTTVNTRHLKAKAIPWLMALASGVMVLFFIQAFDLSLTWPQIVQRAFVGALAATINYVYADMFYRKWVEQTNANELPSLLNQYKSRVDELDALVKQRDSAIIELQSQLNEAKPQLKELQAMKIKDQKERTCPYCKEVMDNPRSLTAHKGHCDKNPNVKKAA